MVPAFGPVNATVSVKATLFPDLVLGYPNLDLRTFKPCEPHMVPRLNEAQPYT
jgi:hypothetical protein